MKDDRLDLIHILECVERIEAYTVGGRDERRIAATDRAASPIDRF